MSIQGHDRLEGTTELPPGLRIAPIGAHAPPRPRLEAALLTLLLTSGLGVLGERFSNLGWLMRRVPVVQPPLRTVTVQFIEDLGPPGPVEGREEPAGGEPPHQPPPAQVDLGILPPAAVPEVLPDDLPQTPSLALSDLAPQTATLPTEHRAGGTGGPGTASSGGSGAGHGAAGGAGRDIRHVAGMESILIRARDVQIISQERPDYPERALLNFITGEVIVHCSIDALGHPTAFDIVSGPKAFHQEIGRVVPQWRFKPIPRIGPSTRIRLELIFRFWIHR